MSSYVSLRVDASEVGQVFGGRTQAGPSFAIRAENGEKRRVAVCECKCGRVEVVQLKHRHRTCAACKATTHGLSKEPEFGVWQGMIRRCHDARSKDFARYGGRGIVVCARWRNSFVAFYADMGQRPTPKHQIDRRDNDGNYEPSNCRWVTASVNQRNKHRRGVVA